MEATDIPSTCALKFTASWCGPCQNKDMIKHLHELCEQYNVQLIEVDVDSNQTLANHFNVSSIPLLVVIEDEKEVDRCVGYDAGKFDSALSKIKRNTENQIILPILKEAELNND